MRFLIALLLLATPVAAAENIIIVLDTSGSMSNYMQTAKKNRIVVAQDALVEVLSDLPESTNVGIVTFNGWIYKLGPVDQAKMQRAIRNVQVGGGTPLYEYTKGAATELLKARANNQNVGVYKLLVVTDGIAGDEELNTDQRDQDNNISTPGVLTDIINRGITVDAIGLDMQQDHPLSTQINGRYMRGDDQRSLTQAVKKLVGETSFDDPNTAKSSAEFLKILDEEFSDEFATAVLASVSALENQPIGEDPPKPVTVGEDAPQPPVESEIPDISKQAQSGDPADDGSVFFWIVATIFGVIIIMFFVSMLARY
jgi:uncharacterized protein YegL